MTKDEAQKQEPVAWMWEKSHYPESRTVELGLLFKKTDSYGDVEWTPLYTSPQAKPWIELTDEEVYEYFSSEITQYVSPASAFFFAIRFSDRKLKEKNT